VRFILNPRSITNLRVIKSNTRDITVVAILEAEESGTTWVSAQVSTRAILSSVTENSPGYGEIDKVAVLEPEQVPSKGRVERNIDVAVSSEREVRDRVGEVDISLKSEVTTGY